MVVKAKLQLLVRNYLWPALYAVAAAVLVEVANEINAPNSDTLDQSRLLAAGLAALVAFISSRLNPYAGRTEPVVEPHK